MNHYMKNKIIKFLLFAAGIGLLSFICGLFAYLPQSDFTFFEAFEYNFLIFSIVALLFAVAYKTIHSENVRIGDWVEVGGKHRQPYSWKVIDYNPITEYFQLKNPIEGGRIFVKKNRLIVLPKIENGSWVKTADDKGGWGSAFGVVYEFDGIDMKVYFSNGFFSKESILTVRPASFTEIFDNQLGL